MPLYLFISKLLSDFLLRAILVFMKSSELLLVSSPDCKNLKERRRQKKKMSQGIQRRDKSNKDSLNLMKMFGFSLFLHILKTKNHTNKNR